MFIRAGCARDIRYAFVGAAERNTRPAGNFYFNELSSKTFLSPTNATRRG